MAVAEMCKLNLVAMAYDRDGILNALQRTRATEIKTHSPAEDTAPLVVSVQELSAELTRAESALEYLVAEVSDYNKANKIKTEKPADGLGITYTEFMAAGDRREETLALISRIEELREERKNLFSALALCQREKKAAEIYSGCQTPFEDFSDTAHAKVKLGTVALAAKDALVAALDKCPLAACSVLAENSEEALVLIVYHKDDTAAAKTVQESGLSPCPYTEGSGQSAYNKAVRDETENGELVARNREELYALGKDIRKLKIYCDYLRFELEKAQACEKFRATETTFLLEAYVPTESKESVAAAIDGVTQAAFYEFSEPAEDEVPPTLYKNNAVVENFEAITDMYSPVNSKEFDPNAIMSFFYSLFLGFIMADIGYGLLMFFGCGAMYLKLRKSGGMIRRLCGVFAVGGIFTVLWGFLFNSFFGIELAFMATLLPNAKEDMWTFLGIKIPAVLVISLELGIVHLLTGYVCKIIQCARRKQFWDGVWDGAVWVLFSLGVALAIVGLTEEAHLPSLAYAGGILAGASLLIAMLTAGRKEKFVGKFIKGFGAAYGVINYASDVLSYARLYGLMLSGAVIAQIISGYCVTGVDGGVGFIVSGNPMLIVLGVVVMLVGHLFNFAIGLLGAYIHDARLQYVEFYGRFYEGEGELFRPLGSQHKYVRLNG